MCTFIGHEIHKWPGIALANQEGLFSQSCTMGFSDRSLNLIVHGKEQSLDYLVQNMLNRPIMIHDVS